MQTLSDDYVANWPCGRNPIRFYSGRSDSKKNGCYCKAELRLNGIQLLKRGGVKLKSVLIFHNGTSSASVLAEFDNFSSEIVDH